MGKKNGIEVIHIFTLL